MHKKTNMFTMGKSKLCDTQQTAGGRVRTISKNEAGDSTIPAAYWRETRDSLHQHSPGSRLPGQHGDTA